MIPALTEKRLLQAAMALACTVPLSAGAMGMLLGTDGETGIDTNSHVRYLSGLLFGIGLGFAGTISRIERHTARVHLLTGIVVIGGIGRLLGVLQDGLPHGPMQLALAMELIVTPLLCLWQTHLARRFS